MKFPPYVPECIRNYYLKLADNFSLAMEQEKSGAPHEGDFFEYKEFLRKRQERMDLLTRLVTDSRMQEAYSRLHNIFGKDEEWESFITCITTSCNCDSTQSDLDRANNIKSEIQLHAGKLANSLKKLETLPLDIEIPAEFYNIRSLLERTSYPAECSNKNQWEENKRYIFGDLEIKRTERKDRNYASYKDLYGDEAGKYELCDKINRVWSDSPRIHLMIQKLSEIAQSYDPQFSTDDLNLATNRENNKRAQFIRLLALNLKKINVKITSDIKHVIAAVTDVVLNSPDDTSTSYDNVRYILKNW